jgi:hypothetical protein
MDVERNKRALEERLEAEVQKKRLTVQEALARMNSNTNEVSEAGITRLQSSVDSECLKTLEGAESRGKVSTPDGRLKTVEGDESKGKVSTPDGCLKTWEGHYSDGCILNSCSSDSGRTCSLFLGSLDDSAFYDLPAIYDGSTFSYDGTFPDFGGAENVGFASVCGEDEDEGLDPVEVGKAREEEIQELERRVYEVVDVQEAWDKTGKAPIGVRWVDVLKKEGIYRSRLVAKDFRPQSRKNDIEGLYAAMPPLELVKLLMARAYRVGEVIMLIDIKKAHLYAPIEGDVYTDLPPERKAPGKCAKLKYTLYGMRVAAKNWEKEYSRAMVENGFLQGVANASSFYHESRGIRVVVHGDDFVCSGAECDLLWLEESLRKRYPLKMRGILGPGPNHIREGVILNRKVRYLKEGGIEFEADDEHVPKMLQASGLEGCNTTSVPGTKEIPSEREEFLDPRSAGIYRSVVARGNYLAQDRLDIRYTVKELCKKMSKPTNWDWMRAKKLCRYLAGHPKMKQHMIDGDDDYIEVYTDADWGGCTTSRLSTSGGAIVAFGMCVKFWSSTQGGISRSSGESELYSTAKGMSEGLGLQSMCKDLGIRLQVRVRTDSDACRGTCNRSGLGRLKHIEVETLWVQEAVGRNRVELARVSRTNNPSDCLTKLVPKVELDRQCKMLGFAHVLC